METTTRTKPDAARSARVFGCTIEQAKRLMRRNAESLLVMADKAAKTGRLVNGYTEQDLRQSAQEYFAASA